MPNAKRSKAARTKTKQATAKAAGSGPSPSNGFAASPAFSFTSPPSAPSFPKSPSPGPSGTGTPTKRNFTVPSSSEESGSSDEDDDSEDESESSPEADEDDTPREKTDEELTPEEALVRAEERKEAGNVLFKKKDYPSATRLYTQAISLSPTNPAYLTNRAASLMGSRSYSAALADCVAATALQSAAPQSKTLLRLARCQLALGLGPAAQQVLDQLLKLDPSNPQVGQERARAARIAKHVENCHRERTGKNWSMVLLAVDALAKEVEDTPREWRSWKVEALVGKKKYDEASGQAADLLRSNPAQSDVLYFRGVCLYYTGNHPQALAHFTAALKSDPDFVLARTLLRRVKLIDSLKDAGNEAFKSSKLQEAIDKYTEAIEVDPENESIRAILLSNRATAYLRLKKTDEALTDCTDCLELNPSYFKALRTRGRIHLSLEAWEDAIRDFKAAYELAPAGSADESALGREVKDAEAKFKKSKMKDHYKTLGIQSNSTEDEIKKGYRKMSLIHHPDKGGTDEKFKEIGEAYAILSDPQRRRKFDSGIDESDPMSGMGNDFGDMGGFPGHGHGGHSFEHMFGGGGFGGGGGYGGGGGRGPYGFG